MNDIDDVEAPVANLLAERLLAARTGVKRLLISDLPTELTEAEAYAVQRRLALQHGPIGGFKVACKPGAPRIMAPIYARDLVTSGERLELPTGEPIGIELEIGFRLITELPEPGSEDFVTKVRRAVEMLPVLEIVRSRYVAPLGVGPMLNLADNQINGGLVVGPALRDWSAQDVAAPHAMLQLGDEIVVDGAVAVPGGDAFENFLVLARMVGGHCGGLRPGQVVITGSLNGLPWVQAPISVKAEIGGLGAVALEIEAR